ncbi:Hypothetical predicted protein [Mytilus galloprovincialis]|uniref:ISXO2-like transposase domain-containing protein n=1 Tax=Mytilus galloprovincialis TaxID=29158 RepID=A0A8B6H1Y4_MYTGA|nr:Hypothetical predicted protein [Mytilus galloprovincialis]
MATAEGRRRKKHGEGSFALRKSNVEDISFQDFEYEMIRFQGDVELNESLFGRKINYNRGKPTGNRKWIFGMIERSSNKIVMYPVDSKGADVLIPLIQKHVEPVSRIFSNSLGPYSGLNRLRYGHFTVIHKTSFNT